MFENKNCNKNGNSLSLPGINPFAPEFPFHHRGATDCVNDYNLHNPYFSTHGNIGWKLMNNQ